MNRHRVFDSIATRLLLLGLCIVIFGTVVRYLALSNFLREDLSTVVASQQLTLATYVAHDVDLKIVQRQALLARLAANLPMILLKRPERLRTWLKLHHEDQQLFSAGLFVVDVRGKALAGHPVLPDRANADFSDRDYIQAGLGGSAFVGHPVLGGATKDPLLPMAAPIRDKKHKVQAVLVGVTALATPGFLDALLQSRIGETTGGVLLISPRDKLFVASSQPDMVLKPTPPPGINALLDRAMAGFRGVGVTVNAEGVEEVSAMASVPSAGWFVVARLPTIEAFATVYRLQNFLIKHAALAILVFAILASTGLYFIFRPLFRAAELAERMTQDELPLKPLPVVRNDEIGHLISAFNRLLTKLNDNQVELAHIAHHDSLTGLPNRALLSDRLAQVLAHAHRKNTQVGLLFMDLDGFKDINDTHGHDAGDEVLRQIAARLTKIVRKADTLARVGGDEFVLVLSDLEDRAEEMASIVATKCIDALNAPFSIAGTTCVVGVSIGIALGTGENSLDALLLAADRAMYQAKANGRGRYVTFKL